MRTEVRLGLPEESCVQWEGYTDLLRKMQPEALLRLVDGVLSGGWYGTRTKEPNDTPSRWPTRSGWSVSGWTSWA
jgi:hypothetical protein